jgi:hypothetical protein
MKPIILVLSIIVSNSLFAQEQEYYAGIAANSYNGQIIISDFYLGPTDFKELPSKSTLYILPLKCGEGIELNPSNIFNWGRNNSIIYGESFIERKVFLYDIKGKLIREIENAELFTFLYDNYPVFVRGTRILTLNLDSGLEDLIYEFDSLNYTFRYPGDDGYDLPNKFDYYWGGIRGYIFALKSDNMDANYDEDLDIYTFVIDPKTKELTFWKLGYSYSTDR